jgi:hypothetical protein
VLERVDAVPPGARRDAEAVAALAELAVSAPGRLSLALAREGVLQGSEAGRRLEEAPRLLAACFALEVPRDRAMGAAELERAARVTAALAAVATVADAFRRQPPGALAPLVTRIALELLGAPSAPPR